MRSWSCRWISEVIVDKQTNLGLVVWYTQWVHHTSIPERECLFVSLSVAALFLTQGMSRSNVLSQPDFRRSDQTRGVAQGTDGERVWGRNAAGLILLAFALSLFLCLLKDTSLVMFNHCFENKVREEYPLSQILVFVNWGNSGFLGHVAF